MGGVTGGKTEGGGATGGLGGLLPTAPAQPAAEKAPKQEQAPTASPGNLLKGGGEGLKKLFGN